MVLGLVRCCLFYFESYFPHVSYFYFLHPFYPVFVLFPPFVLTLISFTCPPIASPPQGIQYVCVPLILSA